MTGMDVETTRFIRACRGEPIDRVPVWLMRQAGRYLPEYQQLRQHADFLTLCRDPALVARATLDAVRYLNADAAIIFSDITLPAAAMGLQLTFGPGPHLQHPVRTRDAIETLAPVDAERDLGFVLEGIRRTRSELPCSTSLIGFVGAPLTLAGYMVEGVPTPQWSELKRFLFATGDLAHALLERVTEAITAHAAAQVRAGCDAVQLFDTTAGELPSHELDVFAFRWAREAIARLKPLGVPIIYFARRIGAHLEGAASLGADVLGIDWTVSIAEARRRVGEQIGLMGNLDPAVLLASRDEIDRRVREILEEARGPGGFIFNLGHGVLPATPPENARQVIRSVEAHGT